MARSRVVGVPKLRRLLRRLPDQITADIKREVARSAEVLKVDMIAEAPHSSIKENISVKLSPDGLTARIGLIGRRANRRGFLARIFEFGAKPHEIKPRGASLTASGRRRKGKGAKAMLINGSFVKGSVRHPGLKAKPFFFRPFIRQKRGIIQRLREAVRRAVNRASSGA